MDQQSVHHLQGELSQIFMRAVHGVSRLKGSDSTPPLFLEEVSRLFGPSVCGKPPRIVPFGKEGDRSAYVDTTPGEYFLHAGMVGVIGVKHLCALGRFIRPVYILYRNHPHQLAGLRRYETSMRTDIELSPLLLRYC